MLKFALLFWLAFSGTLCYGQSDKSLIGTWKVVEMFTGEVYFNMKTDSISVTEEMKRMYDEPHRQQQLGDLQKRMFGLLEYRFDRDGTMAQIADDTMIIVAGKYRANPKVGVIEYNDRGGDGRLITDTINYKFKEGLLYLKYNWPGRPVEVTLEKIKTKK